MIERIAWGLQREAPAGVAERANEELQRYTPKDRGLPYLYCYWEPGEPWCPIERFVIAEMYPRAMIVAEHNFMVLSGASPHETRFAELNGPSPRAGAYYDKVLGRLVFRTDEWIEGQAVELRPTFTLRQWTLWRTEGALAKPVWVVQGEHGGHKRRFNLFEETLLKMQRKPAEAPVPGKLPYAEPDRRTYGALMAGAALARLSQGVGDDWHDKMMRAEANDGKGVTLSDAEAQLIKTYNEWLDNQIDNCR